MRSLLDEVEDLRISQSPQGDGRRGRRTWLVSCALASGKALGLGADMVVVCLSENDAFGDVQVCIGLTGGILGLGVDDECVCGSVERRRGPSRRRRKGVVEVGEISLIEKDKK
mgnify:CR=1 FL=1